MEKGRLEEFMAVDMRCGRVLSVKESRGLRNPAYWMEIDFGPEIGTLSSSSQLCLSYTPDELEGRLVIAAVNLGTRKVGSYESRCLVLGFPDESGGVRLALPDGEVPPGSRLL